MNADSIRAPSWGAIRYEKRGLPAESAPRTHRGVRASTSTPFGALSALAAEQHGLVSRLQCGDLGLSSKVLWKLVSHGFLTRLLPDVFTVGGPPATWQRSLMSGVLQLGPSATVAVRAAAALQGLDTFRPGALEFAVDPVVRVRLPFGQVHRPALRSEELDRVVLDGIPCTSPVRTVFDLAAVVGRRRLEHVIDGGLRDGRFTESELVDVLERLRCSGRPGVRNLEAALGVLDGPVATSVLERRFLRLLAQGELPIPEGQVVVTDRTGRFVARVDFAYPGTPVVVELEGHRYHSTRGQRQRDAARRNDLESLGRHVLVFTYEDIRDRSAHVLTQVRRALAPYLGRVGA